MLICYFCYPAIYCVKCHYTESRGAKIFGGFKMHFSEMEQVALNSADNFIYQLSSYTRASIIKLFTTRVLS